MPCVRIYYTDARGYIYSIRRRRQSYAYGLREVVHKGCKVLYAVACA